MKKHAIYFTVTMLKLKNILSKYFQSNYAVTNFELLFIIAECIQVPY